MNLSERITMDPEICHGKPTVRGLRYTVESILELLSSGMAIEQILALNFTIVNGKIVEVEIITDRERLQQLDPAVLEG